MKKATRALFRILSVTPEGSVVACLLSVLLLLAVSASLHAGPRDFDQAKAIAAEKAAALGRSLGEQAAVQARARASARLQFQRKTAPSVKKTGTHDETVKKTGKHSNATEACSYYIFNFDDNTGYAIVSGDDQLPAIVGYSRQGSIDEDDMPPALSSFLTAYEATLQAVQRGDRVALSTVRAARTRRAGSVTPVEPLLGSQAWGQGTPYNKLCPLYDSENRGVAGCVATVMAEIMSYYKYPSALLADIPTYEVGYTAAGVPIPVEEGDDTPPTYTKTYGGIAKGTIYDWDNMIDSYPEDGYTDAQADAVATLMAHCGQAAKMLYGKTSVAYDYYLAEAFVKNFGYDADLVQHLYRRFFSLDEWNAILQRELSANRPIYYAGCEQDTDTGHAFLCDGVDADGYYHINWGWRGNYNGYFDISLLNYLEPKGEGEFPGFTEDNQAVIGITPDNGVEDQPLVTYDGLALTDMKVAFTRAQRTGTADTFTGTVTAEVSNKDKAAHDVLLAVAIENADSTYTRVSVQPKEITMASGAAEAVALNFDYAFPTGIYQLLVLESTDQGATWHPCRGSQTCAITVKAIEQAIVSASDVPKEMVVIDGLKYQLDSTTFEATIFANDYEDTVVIPASVTYEGMTYPVTAIDEDCFYECAALKSVTIPEGITALPYFAFQGCTALEKVILPSTLIHIGSSCFDSCRSLKSINLPEGITRLPMSCFYGCESITEVVIPSHITKLGSYCFMGCTGLKTIDLHEDITALGKGCFASCNNVKTLICRIKTPLPIDSLFISNYKDDATEPTDFKSDCVLYVPAESLDAYKTADIWKQFTTILPISPTGIRQAVTDALSITVNGDAVTLSGLTDGTTARFYTPDGKLIATAVATNGSASVHLSDPLVIARVGKQTIKIVTAK